MSHRKFNAPRRGSLGFLPRGRSHAVRGQVRSWPKDDQTKKPHLCAFIGFKAGMTHIVREVVRHQSRLNKKDVVEAVTVIETPPMMGIGIIGYKETAVGLKPVTTYWAKVVSNEVKRSYYKNWYRSCKGTGKEKADVSAFSKVGERDIEDRLEKIKNESVVVRLIAHTQMNLLRIGQRKAHIIEIQINGGTVAQKVDFAKSFLEKRIGIDSVFAEGELVDTIGVGKGHGWEGVIHRFGAKRLQKKTHRGRRKVACIGPWNPKRVSWTIARYGQRGCHHRTEMNKRIYKLFVNSPSTPFDQSGKGAADLTTKSINPMGGFPHYGLVKNDFLLIRGSVVGIVKRAITLRKPINGKTARIATEEINLKWIDTSSKFGHGRFQTPEERKKYLGPLKIKGAASAAKASS